MITVRLLRDSNIEKFYQENTGYIDTAIKKINNHFSKGGLVLISGTTGSRKSTAIASILGHSTFMNRNIVSIEDPIEYKIKNVTQHELSEALNFRNSVRAFVRHNPDIIFLGEIRDKETAQAAIEASRTGHVVISTIHTGSIESIKERFTDDFNIQEKAYTENVIFASNHYHCENRIEVTYV